MKDKWQTDSVTKFHVMFLCEKLVVFTTEFLNSIELFKKKTTIVM